MTSTATTSQEIAARIAALDEQTARHQERAQSINDEIGERIADGGDPAALREERAQIREALEDLVATRSQLVARMESAERAEALHTYNASLAEAAALRDQAHAMIGEGIAAVEQALRAVRDVHALHDSRYALAIGRARSAAQRIGAGRPAVDFIVEGEHLSAWTTFENDLARLILNAPLALRRAVPPADEVAA